MRHIPKIIEFVVKKDLCTGCGLCITQCSNQSLIMDWNDFGFLIPKQTNDCSLDAECIKVCPFNPFPDDEVKTEDELADIFLEKDSKTHKNIGKYHRIYVGYSNKFRFSSSSGGLATYLASKLLENKIVNHVVSVIATEKQGNYYEYSIVSNFKNLLRASKTKYYPVTLSDVFLKINELEGNVAIVGIACFIKSIRLKQYYQPELKKKIPFLIGIICGGIKSAFFSEYLAGRAGIKDNNFLNPEFRIKDFESSSSDYSYGCFDFKGNSYEIKMRVVGDMWGTGMFKNNACDFCDDVTTELADISLGDAWFSPYNLDGRGTNVIVTRSSLAEKLINDGIINKELFVEDLTLDKFLESQSGSFNHRQKALNYRVQNLKKRNIIMPPKRHDSDKISVDFQLVQKQRMKIRAKSLILWRKFHDAFHFDLKMKRSLLTLKTFTKINHLIRKFK